MVTLATATGTGTINGTMQVLSCLVALVVSTGVLLWGLRLVHNVLTERGASDTQRLAEVMSEPEPPPSGAGQAARPEGAPPRGKRSFSRLSGTIGSVAIAATFVGIGYWLLYALFFEADLSKVEHIWTYVVSGAALFMPYAFNRLSTLFRN